MTDGRSILCPAAPAWAPRGWQGAVAAGILPTPRKETS